MDQLQEMGQLEKQLRGANDSADLADVDADKVRDVLGDEAAEELERLKQLTKMLEEARLPQARRATDWS